ncbi:MAG: hypothetical protein R3E01_02085 [Pirellulaceae bacterium]
MKVPVLIVAVIAAILLAGCVRSLHPIYTSSDVVFNKELIGTWKQSDQETTWQFTESKDDERDRAFRLVVTDDKGRPGTFLAHLVKLDDELFLDLFPIAPQVANNGFYKFHFQRVHTFLRFGLGGQNLTLAPMNPDWLEKHLQEHPDALSHTNVTPSGHVPTGKEENAAERLLLTASTAQLQRFLRKYADTEGAFGDPIELKKIVQ